MNERVYYVKMKLIWKRGKKTRHKTNEKAKQTFSLYLNLSAFCIPFTILRLFYCIFTVSDSVFIATLTICVSLIPNRAQTSRYNLLLNTVFGYLAFLVHKITNTPFFIFVVQFLIFRKKQNIKEYSRSLITFKSVCVCVYSHIFIDFRIFEYYLHNWNVSWAQITKFETR